MTSEVLCVSTDGDDAVFAARYTSVEYPSYPVLENNIWFWRVKDNGEGVNNDIDQNASLINISDDWFNFYNTPEDFLEDFPRITLFDDPVLQNFVDITKGQIQVQ